MDRTATVIGEDAFRNGGRRLLVRALLISLFDAFMSDSFDKSERNAPI
jgi:hypothetical protein